jgi:hypothetical protein
MKEADGPLEARGNVGTMDPSTDVGPSLSAGDAETPPGELPRDEIFDVLSNRRRQCVLHYLKQHEDRRVELRELVEHVAAWENNTTLEQLDSDERKRVYTALRQSHLPRLERAGIVEYEHMRGAVELTDDARQVQMYLEYVPEHDIPWSQYYLGLTGIAAALVAAVWAGIYPFDGLSGVGLAAILVSLYLLSSVVHTYQSSKNRLGSDHFELE